ncbi:[LysW]-aminoadipate kinase [Paenibacillus campi]|uniref:[LysW]-aminoadipate kinase n=1 Tax=Paenibacillus campi TaxID=3106031 RepID=UPI002B00369F|nr:[LysW]-aminoadipate kinase [Paenibacillus sp. SGZ-1009]
MIVIKLGGAEGVDYTSCCKDIAELINNGEKVVVVHGGSDVANHLGRALGIEPQYVTSSTGVTSRYTTAETIDVLNMAMKGKLNSIIVSALLQAGVQAVGLSGIDGRLIEANKKKAIKSLQDGKMNIIRDDLTGKISRINAELLLLLIHEQYTPVVSPPAYDPEYGMVNVDADRTAAMIANAVGANTLLLMSNIPGLLRDQNDQQSLIPTIDSADLPHQMEFAKGRMKLKLIAAGEAFSSGSVQQVIIADGRKHRPIYEALSGKGTVIKRTTREETLLHE